MTRQWTIPILDLLVLNNITLISINFFLKTLISKFQPPYQNCRLFTELYSEVGFFKWNVTLWTVPRSSHKQQIHITFTQRASAHVDHELECWVAVLGGLAVRAALVLHGCASCQPGRRHPSPDPLPGGIRPRLSLTNINFYNKFYYLWDSISLPSQWD